MTPTKDIQNEHYKKIWEKLQKLTYPCTIVVFGPENNSRTMYRGEHQSVFGIDYCNSAEEAWNVVDCSWPGYPPDLDIYVIYGEAIKL